MQDAPPDSVGVVDTMGCILPEAMKYMVRLVKSLTNLPVEVHTHNDFGMAVATELAGVEAGAEVVHSCANGLGERTGNAALEELIVALHVLYGYETQYNLAKLPELGALVEPHLRNSRPRLNKPILGARNFTRESGIGVDLVVKEPLAMLDPASDARLVIRVRLAELSLQIGFLACDHFVSNHQKNSG